MTRDVRHYLFDILESIDHCERLIAGKSVADLERDVIARLALERAIEIISEASRHIPEDDKAMDGNLPWRQIADIGNHLRHAYHLTAVALIHGVATDGVAELKPVIERLYERHKRPGDPWPGRPVT
ncbi:MAG: DUF86 domain-containing protein [Caulobacteraceae bacterium]|nr:MAG: DUF86 domain-containing protein [Caulobacteraceae bacterium]